MEFRISQEGGLKTTWADCTAFTIEDAAAIAEAFGEFGKDWQMEFRTKGE